MELSNVIVELVRLVLGVVHLFAQVDNLLEEPGYLEEVLEFEFCVADVHHKVQNLLLTLIDFGGDTLKFKIRKKEVEA